MTNPQTPTSGKAGRNGVISIILACLLIGHFLWNLLTPAHAFPPRSDQVMTMVIDAMMFAGLLGLKGSMPKPLFWIALAAGIGLFALRLSLDGWWTGHLIYRIGPR